MRLRAAFFLAFIALGLFVLGPIRDGITLGSDPAAHAGVRVGIVDDLQVYLDEELTQVATSIDFGTVQVEPSGNQPSPVSVPVWVENLSADAILLTLDDTLNDDYPDADVGFLGQTEPPLLLPGQVFAGSLGLEFSALQTGDFNFTIFFESGEPPPDMPPVINLTIDCGSGQQQKDDLTVRVHGSVTDVNGDLVDVVIDWDNLSPTVVTSGFDAIDVDHTYAVEGLQRNIQITATDARDVTTILKDSLRPGTGDSDCDGLLDVDELAGWIVEVDLDGDGDKDGPEEIYPVTSDPLKRDTDGDGLTDFWEKTGAHQTDPRKADTDGDGLCDAEATGQKPVFCESHEVQIVTKTGAEAQSILASEPTTTVVAGDGSVLQKKFLSFPDDVDSDNDCVPPEDRGLPPELRDCNSELWDGAERLIYKTDPNFDDTDRDRIDDYVEIVNTTGRLDPRIADVPSVEISVQGRPAAELLTGTVEGCKESYGKKDLTSTQTTTFHGDVVQQQITEEKGFEISGEVSVEIGTETKVTPKIGGAYHETDTTVDTTTTTDSKETVDFNQGEYQEFKECWKEQTVAPTGKLRALLKVKNLSDTVSVKLTNVTLTALLIDPHRRAAGDTSTWPVGTLSLAGPGTEIELTPGEEKGNLEVNADAVDASAIERMLALPRALSLQVANFNLEAFDQATGRTLSWAYLAGGSGVIDSTVMIKINFGDGRVERYQVATNRLRDPEIGDFPGITMEQALADIKRWRGALGDTEFEYETKTIDGVSFLTKVRDTANSQAKKAAWLLIGSPSMKSRLQPDVDFEDIVLKGGDHIRLVYVKDEDGDRLLSSEEIIYGSSDTNPDTDGDGLTDFEESKEGWQVAVVGRVPRFVVSDPTDPNSDSDGLTDFEERGPLEEDLGTDPIDFDTDNDLLHDDVDLLPLDPFNAPPVLNLTLSIAGFEATISGTVTDAPVTVTGEPDAIENVVIDWDDGTPPETITSGLAGTFTRSRTYTGAVTISVTATDERDATSDPVEFHITPPEIEQFIVTVDGDVARLQYIMQNDLEDGFSLVFDWGDGTREFSCILFCTGAGGSKNHKYSSPYKISGYTITLTATDTKGATAVRTEDIKPHLPDIEIIRIATFAWQFSFVINAEVTATASDSFDTVTRVDIDWGDGQSDSNTGCADTIQILALGHFYASVGDYTITITATDVRGAKKVETCDITVFRLDAVRHC